MRPGDNFDPMMLLVINSLQKSGCFLSRRESCVQVQESLASRLVAND